MITVINLIRIPMSFLAIIVLQKFKKRPLYLSVSFFVFLVLSGIVAFTHVVEKGYLKKTTIQESIGYVNLIHNPGVHNIKFLKYGQYKEMIITTC